MSNKKLDLNEAKLRVKNNIGQDYEIADFVPGKYEYSVIRHIICGKEYQLQNQMFYSKNNSSKKRGECPFCNRINYNKDDVQKIINNLLDSSYEVLEYKNKRTPIKIFHKKCGKNIELYLGNIQKGQRCQECESGFIKLSNEKKYNLEKFQIAVKDKYNDLFSVTGEYIDYNTRINIRCNTCKNEFSATPNHFMQGPYCPFCKATAGEQIIMKYLKQENINFEIQKLVKINDSNYKFDFFIPSKNLFIEYDGKQHFKPSFGYTKEEREKNFELTKLRDMEKNKYCKDNNYNLLRIPYTKLNKIHNILLENKIISSTTIESTSKDGSE